MEKSGTKWQLFERFCATFLLIECDFVDGVSQYREKYYVLHLVVASDDIVRGTKRVPMPLGDEDQFLELSGLFP